MLNAWPNQKIPSSIMNINGRTAAASAISAPRVSVASRRALDCRECSILSHHPEFPENAIEHYGEGQGHAVRDLQRIWIVERDSGSGQSKSHERHQNVTDVSQGLKH